ncbi:hypothetical protein, conserved [Eimeria praecox]|uniref:Uncharacterized protein n=1 Tax=Eimeria praecox TaxID=51316 RepID=U6G1F6_9EIME|nr:hypothetical protein, conserved [Eimeria praecox]
MGSIGLSLSLGLQALLQLSGGSEGHSGPKATLLIGALFLLCSLENAASLASAFSLSSHASPLSCSWKPVIQPPPLLAAHVPVHADSAGASHDSGEGEDKQQSSGADPDIDAEEDTLPRFIPMGRAGITAPMQHQPRGTRFIPGFPGPQFVSLRPSLMYRRRLRKHRRDEGWQFSNLPSKRNFFAARRNHRDQLMHKWMYSRHRECRRRAKEVVSVLKRQSREIFDKEEEHGPEASKQALEQTTHTGAREAACESLATAAADGWSKAGGESFKDCLTSVRAALHSVPSAKVLSTMSAAALGRLHTQLRELLVDAMIAVVPPECVAAAASEGFSLPPPAAALAASPLPWWSSGGGLQPWRGRKECWAQQSRRVNWASPRRAVEPIVSGVLLPREAAAVVAAERIARNRELVQSIRSFMFASSTGPEGQSDASPLGSAAAQHQEGPCGDPAAASATPWFVQGEEERLQRLLRWDSGRLKEQQNAYKRSSSIVRTNLPQRLPDAAEESAAQKTGGEGSAGSQQGVSGEASAVRRALGAAIDVALLLSEAIVTKKSGAAAPFSWVSPFLRSSSSSRRRRRRQRGRPPPEKRLPSRQARRLASRDKRVSHQQANSLAG